MSHLQTPRTRKSILIVEDIFPRDGFSSGDTDSLALIKYTNAFSSSTAFLCVRKKAANSRDSKNDISIGATPVVFLPETARQLKHNILQALGKEPDILWIRRHTSYQKIGSVLHKLFPDARIVFDPVDLHFLREIRSSEHEENAEFHLQASLDALKAESACVSAADLVICISSHELKILKRLHPTANYFMIPICRGPSSVNLHQIITENNIRLGFIGSFQHIPNRDALQHFLSNIWPEIIQRFPNATFVAAGRGLSPKPLIDGIEFLGEIDDINEYMQKINISTAPLRYGAGQKGKVVESLSFGIPVIASSIAAEGLEDGIKESIYLAHNAKEYIASIEEIVAKCKMGESLHACSLDKYMLSTERYAELVRAAIAQACNMHKDVNHTAYHRQDNTVIKGHAGNHANPRFLIYPQVDYINKSVFNEGLYERELVNIFYMHGLSSRPGGVILDVGANIGTFSIPCALLFPELTFHAFEPNLRPFSQLCSAIALNSVENIVPHREAIGNPQGGCSTISIPSLDYQSTTNVGGLSLDPDVYKWKVQRREIVPRDHAAATNVRISSIDHMMSIDLMSRPIFCIKVDVEGFELEVFQGALNAIKDHEPLLLFEAWSPDYAPAFQKKQAEVARLISSMNYRIIKRNELVIATPN